MLGATSNLQAQLSVGGGLAYGSDLEEIGLQVRGIYSIADQWRAGADLIYYLDGIEGLSYYEINANGHFVFTGSDGKFLAYALAGLNYFRVSVLNFGGGSEIGLNLGGGAQFMFSDSISGLLELKYVIGDADQFVAGLGVMFEIGN